MLSHSSWGASRHASEDPDFQLYDVRAANEVLLRLEGELDLMAVPRFLERFDASLAPGDTNAVVLDMGGLSFLDVAGARALVRVRDLARAKGVLVRLSGLSDGRLPVAQALHLRQYFGGDEDAAQSHGD